MLDHQNSLLAKRAVAQREGLEAAVFKRFDAQLGEMGWHSANLDTSLDAMSDQHAERMIALLAGKKAPRVLELGAYAHHSAHVVAARAGGLGVSHDISTTSLSIAAARGEQRGLKGKHIAVAGDFHDLPFADDAFDLVFIASSIHHTWRPWIVMQEMARVCRPGGIIHIENEPVGREACLYQFRGNRAEDRTNYEKELERLGLTQTVSSPFPGSRSEQLFGIVENDRIPLHIYEETLKSLGEILDWSVTPDTLMGDLEAWMLKATAPEIVARLSHDLKTAEKVLGLRDRLAGFSSPTEDQLWSLAYRIEHLAQESDQRSLCQLFGAVLQATLRKPGAYKKPLFLQPELFRRPVKAIHGIHLDQPREHTFSVLFDNLLTPAAFTPDQWSTTPENYGDVLTNLRSCCEIAAPIVDGIMILRVYSIAQDEPYFVSVQVGDRLVYSHCVAATEGHLAKFMVRRGERVLVHHHTEDGNLLPTGDQSRIVARFAEVTAYV